MRLESFLESLASVGEDRDLAVCRVAQLLPSVVTGTPVILVPWREWRVEHSDPGISVRAGCIEIRMPDPSGAHRVKGAA